MSSPSILLIVTVGSVSATITGSEACTELVTCAVTVAVPLGSVTASADGTVALQVPLTPTTAV